METFYQLELQFTDGRNPVCYHLDAKTIDQARIEAKSTIDGPGSIGSGGSARLIEIPSEGSLTAPRIVVAEWSLTP